MNILALIDIVASQIIQFPNFVKLLGKILHKASPETFILLDYPLDPRPRWNIVQPHQELYDIINKNRNVYKHNLQLFMQLSEWFTAIPEKHTDNSKSTEPCWINGWLPALDGVALYCFIALNRPKLYIEVGSGNSTKFARKSIVDHNLDTIIISIDPSPREEINAICDEIIRKPVEQVDMKIFDRLNSNDILFVDNSHRSFMNSDVTTIFLDVFPRLRSGVFVEIHDVMLPYDYPAEWIHRYYSEQYLLAAYLLAKGNAFDIVLPNAFISCDNELSNILSPLWEEKEMRSVQTSGGSFWIKMN